MTFIPITIGISRPVAEDAKGKQSGAGLPGSASSFAAGKKIPADIKQRIFERDQFTCRCCGFKSKKYQEILFLNHNPADMNDKNMATACIFCHQCFNLEGASEMKSGFLIWLPEISQAELHHIARAIYVARISQGPVAEAARLALDALMARREEARRRISTDEANILALVLRDYLGAGHYQLRDKKLKGIRLMPQDRRIIKEADLEFNQFPQILAYWRSKDGPFGGKTPPQWMSIYKEIAKAA